MILAVDPSGNFIEGKGTTGLCLFDEKKMKVIDTKAIYAKDYISQVKYWWEVTDFVIANAKAYAEDIIVVIEDYFLYAHKAESQINSKLETSRLIGVLQYECYKNKICQVFQPASLVKTRWSDEILLHKGYIILKGRGHALPDGTYVNKHCKDAIRHAVHFATFIGGKK